MAHRAGDIASRAPDSILLDLVLPLCRWARSLRQTRTWSHVPIIVLSARGGEADKVAALDQGADDYLTKPFGMAELLARLRVVLRRERAGAPEQLTAGDVTIDLRRYLVFVAGTRCISHRPNSTCCGCWRVRRGGC